MKGLRSVLGEAVVSMLIASAKKFTPNVVYFGAVSSIIAGIRFEQQQTVLLKSAIAAVVMRKLFCNLHVTNMTQTRPTNTISEPACPAPCPVIRLTDYP